MRISNVELLLSSILISILTVSIAQGDNRGREGKLFNVLQIVRFPNDPCVGTSSKNGTCYTEAECSSKGGANSGSCAQGFGVCCIFTINCGATSNENCTYFESSGNEVGPCSVKICPCSSSICQLRLDFNTFVIAGPSTTTTTTVKLLGGSPSIDPDAKSATLNTRCLIDQFSVTNPGGPTPPSICGTNTGQHMYVDSSSSCNTLDFLIGTETTSASRTWSIKVTQYDCSFNNLAPEGCTQYFFGSTTNTVQTYNYAGGHHLANQDQNICVRRERTNCRICWTTMATTDLAVSGPIASAAIANGGCCRYGNDGQNTNGYDCVLIPGAENTAGVVMSAATRNCGRQAFNPTTICSVVTPFHLRFLSDGFEFMNAAGSAESANNDAGFQLVYFQDSTNC